MGKMWKRLHILRRNIICYRCAGSRNLSWNISKNLPRKLKWQVEAMWRVFLSLQQHLSGSHLHLLGSFLHLGLFFLSFQLLHGSQFPPSSPSLGRPRSTTGRCHKGRGIQKHSLAMSASHSKDWNFAQVLVFCFLPTWLVKVNAPKRWPTTEPASVVILAASI